MQRVQFDVALMAQDMAEKGWQPSDLAARVRPKVAVSTVTRFLRGERQTHRIAKRLARALGRATKRYIVTEQQAVAS